MERSGDALICGGAGENKTHGGRHREGGLSSVFCEGEETEGLGWVEGTGRS